jgi:hypothetical protein
MQRRATSVSMKVVVWTWFWRSFFAFAPFSPNLKVLTVQLFSRYVPCVLLILGRAAKHVTIICSTRFTHWMGYPCTRVPLSGSHEKWRPTTNVTNWRNDTSGPTNLTTSFLVSLNSQPSFWLSRLRQKSQWMEKIELITWWSGDEEEQCGAVFLTLGFG